MLSRSSDRPIFLRHLDVAISALQDAAHLGQDAAEALEYLRTLAGVPVEERFRPGEGEDLDGWEYHAPYMCSLTASFTDPFTAYPAERDKHTGKKVWPANVGGVLPLFAEHSAVTKLCAAVRARELGRTEG